MDDGRKPIAIGKMGRTANHDFQLHYLIGMRKNWVSNFCFLDWDHPNQNIAHSPGILPASWNFHQGNKNPRGCLSLLKKTSHKITYSITNSSVKLLLGSGKYILVCKTFAFHAGDRGSIPDRNQTGSDSSTAER